MGLWIALAIALVSASGGCQLLKGRDPATTPHPQLERLWHNFLKLPRERAIALAGDPTKRWVAGATGGHPTLEAAREAALEECRKRRKRERMREVCRIYAEGNRIVWEGP